MHQMLRQNQIRLQDIKAYVRTFGANTPMEANEWAMREGVLFDPGSLVFLLEPVKRPTGLSTFAKNQPADPQADMFRVKGMSVVVDRVEGKSWVLNITPSAYEHRFLEQLFREKAKKSGLDGVDFNYVAAAPREALGDARLKELRQLSEIYSKAGSRRTVAQDGAMPDEPAKAMLGFFGADLGSSSGKPVIEIGTICYMIFSTDVRGDNALQNLLQACFAPIGSGRLDAAAEEFEGDVYMEPDSGEMEIEPEYSEQQDYATEPPEFENSWQPRSTALDVLQPQDAPSLEAAHDLGSIIDGAMDGSIQPHMDMQLDMPAILTGDHPVINLEDQLGRMPEDDVAVADVTLPAWYLTSHDIDEMNKAALGEDSRSELPDGLDSLEDDLEHMLEAAAADTDTSPGALDGVAFPGDYSESAPPPMFDSPDFMSPSFDAPTHDFGYEAPPAEDPPLISDWAAEEPSALEAPPDFSLAGGQTSKLAPLPEPVETTAPSAAGGPQFSDDANFQELQDALNGLIGFSFMGDDDDDEPATKSTPTPVTGPAPEIPGFDMDAEFEVEPVFEPVDEQPEQEDSGLEFQGDELEASEPVGTDFEEPQFESDPESEFDALPEPEYEAPEAEPEPQQEEPDFLDEPDLQIEAEPNLESDEPGYSFSDEPSVDFDQIEEAPEADSHVSRLGSALKKLNDEPQTELPAAPESDTGMKSLFNIGDEEVDALFSVLTDKEQPEVNSDTLSRRMSPAAPAAPADVEAEVAAEVEAELAQSDFESEIEIEIEIEPEPVFEQELEPDVSLEPESTIEPAQSAREEVVQDLDDVFAPDDFELEPELETEPTLGSEDLEPVDELSDEFAAESVAPEEPAAPEPPAAVVAADPDDAPAPWMSMARPTADEPAKPPSARRDRISRSSPSNSLQVPFSRTTIDGTKPKSEPPGKEPPRPSKPPAISREKLVEPLMADEPQVVPQSAPPVPSIITPPAAVAPEPELEQEPVEDDEFSKPIESRFEEPEKEEPLKREPEFTEEPKPEVAKPEKSYFSPPTIEVESPEEEQVETIIEAPQATEETADIAESQGPEPALAVLPPVTPVPEPEPERVRPTRELAAPSRQPGVEPKLVISESTRFMARLNQRLSEADRKLSSVSDQIRDRLHSEYSRIVDEANHIEEQNELATTRLTERQSKHLDEVSKDVNNSITALANESRRFIQDMIESAKKEILKMGAELTEGVSAQCDQFNATVDSEVSSAKSGLNSHNQRRLTQYNEEVNNICTGLDNTLQTFLTKFTSRFEHFRTRLTTDIDSLVAALDADVLSISEEIEGSWSRASEKLATDSQSFELWITYIVNRCEMELKQSAKSAYLDRVLPRLTENKDIFRSMLLDMRSNFAEQSEQTVKNHTAQLDVNIESSRQSLVTLIQLCVEQIDSIGKGQQDGLDELFLSTRGHLEEITVQVEEKLEAARREILKNEEEANRLSESTRIEDEPQFRDQKNAAVSTLHDARARADKELESAITASCRHLEEISEELQDDLVSQRTKLISQAKTMADGGIAQIKQAIQDAYHSIESAKEKYME